MIVRKCDAIPFMFDTQRAARGPSPALRTISHVLRKKVPILMGKPSARGVYTPETGVRWTV